MNVTASTSTSDVGWDLVRLAEATPTALKDRVASEIERGERDYQPLEPSDGVSPGTCAAQQTPRNRARFERFADYTLPGDSVVEVGCGWGFVGARVLAAGAGRYDAMDLESAHAQGTTRILTNLGYADRLGDIVTKDLYTLTPSDLAHASFVICSEVIEHVPDPDAALEVLGRTLPEGGELLFSVPLLGKLEHVWGHLSIFTADRLVAMLERAGLEAHHVEPLADQWVLVLAGRRGSPPNAQRLERVREATATHLPPVEVPDELPTVPPQPLRFDNISIDSVDVTRIRRSLHDLTARTTTTTPDGPDGEITIDVASRGWMRRPATAGVSISLDGVAPVKGMRVKFTAESLADVTEVAVTFYGRGDAVAGRWRWKPGPKMKKAGTLTRTATARPGPRTFPLAGPESADLSGAERVDLTITVRSGGTGRLTVSRLAWIR